MARVERLTSGRYRIRWTDPWGKRTSKTFTTAADARAHYRKVLGDMARGEYIRPTKLTVGEWADQWLEGARNLTRGGHDTYRRDLDRHILPVLGKVPVGRLSVTDIDRYLTGRQEDLAASTVHRHYRTLHRLLAVAVERGLIPRNPADHVTPPRIPPTEITVLDAGQVDSLANAISPRYRAWVYVMAYGALRWAESVGLRRERVSTPGGSFLDPSHSHRAQRPGDTPSEQGDTLHTDHQGAGGRQTRTLDPALSTVTQASPRLAVNMMTIQIVEQLIHRGRGEWERCEPKAGSRRTVTLPAFVASELAYHLDAYSLEGDDGLVFPTRKEMAVRERPSLRARSAWRMSRRASSFSRRSPKSIPHGI